LTKINLLQLVGDLLLGKIEMLVLTLIEGVGADDNALLKLRPV
jgi:hypothetical protein